MYFKLFPVFLLSLFLHTTSSLNITINKPNTPFAPSPLPPSHADSDGEAIISLFQNLGRTTTWTSIANITFQGDTYEPEGLVRLGADRYIVSAGQWTAPTVPYNTTINGTDRTPGAGFAHLIVFDGSGERIADATITPIGDDEYHNGGIDFDGDKIWGTIAQYRPNSTAYVYTAEPSTLEPAKVVNYADHLGGVVHDVQSSTITALNWGSRNASTWDLEDVTSVDSGGTPSPPPKSVIRNPSYFIDYQDCKFLGHSALYSKRPIMLCGGVATIGTGDSAFNLGGIALVDVETMVPVAEVPIALRSAEDVPLTQNPIDVSVEGGRLRLYCLPDQNDSTLYVIEAQS